MIPWCCKGERTGGVETGTYITPFASKCILKFYPQVENKSEIQNKEIVVDKSSNYISEEKQP